MLLSGVRATTFVSQNRAIGYSRLSTPLSVMAGSSVERRLVRKLGAYSICNCESATNVYRLLHSGEIHSIRGFEQVLIYARSIAAQRTFLIT